ncbi:MAG: response regulator [Deltaproteobacteria bacterium]|jgi:YesN/AraC family two-component response regulator|nr:response regulator [Deltaproteobacteria bacterium]MBT4525002.1 response regulator [Deltaproteobacteria bacterium]
MPGAKELIEYSKKCSLLYVEDDERLRTDTLRLLDMFFNNIEVATNGKEGLDVFQPRQFDIVISDLFMPIIDGAELSRRIKHIDPNQMIIILSAHDEYEFTEKLKKTGVSDFIFKPLDLQKFIDVLFPICKNIADNKL